MIFAQISEMGLSIRNHAEKSPSRMIVILVFLEMRCKFLDSLGKEGDLDFGGACILVMYTGIADNFRLLLCC